MGKPKYILLIRHGESEGNCDKSVNQFTPNHMVPLTANGIAQAQYGGKVLKEFLQELCFDKDAKEGDKARSIRFYTSPYLRARQTCEHITKGIEGLEGLNFQVFEEARMREQDFGNFQSTPEEMEKIWKERAHYGHFFYRIPHGESAADVYDRVASFNETLFRQFEKPDFPNILVLVTHGIWARVFLMKWFRWSYEEFESLRNIPHCQYLIMKRDHESRQFRLKTPLRTWDDVSDDEDATKEIREEVCFHAKNKLSSPKDLPIARMIQAQRNAFRTTSNKDKKIRQAFNSTLKGHSTEID